MADFSLAWLTDVLIEAGLKVAQQDGWKSRGRRDVGETKGVMCHHTAGPREGNMPSLGIVTKGRSDLPGPLAQLALGRDGTFYVVAAGLANHAGAGSWQGITTGNTSFIGIEAENTGLGDDPWPAVQIDAYQRGVAAILKKIGAPAAMCCGHKEYALPAGRKTDPSFDIEGFRKGVDAHLAGTAPSPALIPAADAEGKPTLRRGSSDPLVTLLQKGVGAQADGKFGAETEADVRAFQRDHHLVPDGIVGPLTWKVLSAA
jgi:peptidoglycan hydrolase-like protein with peptidoglycan-binding domain